MPETSTEELTYIFDVRGLVTYPKFKELIIDPLIAKKNEVRFWTFEHEEVGREMLDGANLTNYSCIFQNDNEDFLTVLRHKLRLPESIRSRFFPRATEIPDETYDKGNRWIDLAKEFGVHTFKYPPILGEGRYLLVESDNSYLSGYRVERYPFALRNLDIARKEGYSAILVPEHPDIWISPNPQSIKPTQVVEALSQKLLGWDGQQLISDLGHEMGFYDVK